MSHEPDLERVAFVCQLAKNWSVLSSIPENKKRVAIILSNYPNKDSRIGNGVGLDVPASLLSLMRLMEKRKYKIKNVPSNITSLMQQLLDGPTNNIKETKTRISQVKISLVEYLDFFSGLSVTVQTEILDLSLIHI